MGQIRGYVALDLTKMTGGIESIDIDGNQFGLEEGGDWRRDKDDNELKAGFLFIAFCDGFDLRLSVTIHGNSITHYDLRVYDGDLEAFAIKKVSITEDGLDVSNLFPSGDEDFD